MGTIWEQIITVYLTVVRVATERYKGSIHFWKKHNYLAPQTLLSGWSKKVDLPKLDAPPLASKKRL
jgi:hypothetical protein